MIDRYGTIYENLKKHNPLYPTPDYLRSVTFRGRSGTWGKKGTVNIGEGKDSEASETIINIVDKPDPRPVYIGVWGDCSVVAQGVWKVQNTRGAASLETFLSKLRIHQIATQDVRLVGCAIISQSCSSGTRRRLSRGCSADVIRFQTLPGSTRTFPITTDLSAMCIRSKGWDAPGCVKGIRLCSCGW